MASFFVCYNYFYYNVLFSGNQTKGSKLSGASVFAGSASSVSTTMKSGKPDWFRVLNDH